MKADAMIRSALLSCVVALEFLASRSQAAPPRPAAPTSQQAEFFEKRVRPILSENCFVCHGAKEAKLGLRLDSRAAVLKGSEAGQVVVPGDPEKSLLIQAIRWRGETKMPRKAKLATADIEALATWVKMGLPWPESSVADASSSSSTVAEVRKSHWAFQPVRPPAQPMVKDRAWPKETLDFFILSKLEEKGLRPSAPADRRTLIRRATFDLTGLPPTPEEVAAFEADRSPEAFARVVDRLLASPHYGERWARHWLDVARYADTKGYVFTEERRFPYAYTYRDYVIRAFNDDLPYDRFLVEQLAADRLPLGEDKRPLAAMGFLTLGRRFLNNQADIIDDRIDVVARGLLGLTVACARCHDHKFDPIPQKDYYSLYGVFASSVEPKDLPLLGEPQHSPAYEAFTTELQAREQKVTDFLQEQRTALVARFRSQVAEYLVAAQKAERQASGAERPPQSANDLSFVVVRRWRNLLNETRKTPHPVFVPWNAFAALAPEEFAARAPEVARKIAANADPAQRVNPLVARAFAGKPPVSLQEVAQRYAELLTAVDREWQETVRKAADSKVPPATLADTDKEALRQVLYGVGTPTNLLVTELDRGVLDRKQRDQLTALRRRVEQWKATSAAAPPRAMVLNDLPMPQTPHVFKRGNPNMPGEAVPRQFLEVLTGAQRKPFQEGSGRLELARAIASRDNPLTARVMVNRIWLHHFGAGLVRTASNFGLRGEPPTHPELLDYLAATFVENGWSMKKLHRLIMLSQTYQQASDVDGALVQKDPDNRLLTHVSRQRLDFEQLRDALLAVAGRLDRTEAGPAVDLTKAPFTGRRTIYGFIDRQNLPGLFRTFDFASPDTSSAQRYATTVPQQALFLMNSPFVIEQARHVLERPELAGLQEPRERIDRLYRLLYGRPAEAEEVALGRRFLEAAHPEGADKGLTAWEKYVQVLMLANEFAFVD